MAIPLLKNGLLDFSKTPDHVLYIAQRNATHSPLLRLPAEIRSQIFHFATSGTEFAIVSSYTSDCRALVRNSSGAYRTDLRGSGFYLSRVSRQIYSETATLIFEGNVFFFKIDTVPIGEDDMLSDFTKTLNRAQRASVRELKLIGKHQVSKWLSRPRRFHLSKAYPSLRMVWIPERYAKKWMTGGKWWGTTDGTTLHSQSIANRGGNREIDIMFY